MSSKNSMTSKLCHDVNKCNIIQKVGHDVKNTSMTSKTRHDIKRFVIIYDNVNDIKNTFSKYFVPEMMNKNVRTPKAGHEIRHDNNKFALKQRTHHDVCHVIKNFYNVRHDVNSIAYVMTSKHLLWCHKHVMILKSHDFKQFALTSACSSWCQNTSWGQKVRHYFKKFAMTSTRRHHAK